MECQLIVDKTYKNILKEMLKGCSMVHKGTEGYHKLYTILFYKNVFRSSSYSSSSFSLFRTILFLFIKSEIMDGFWSSRCLNDPVDLPDKIGSFLSGAATSMVVKNGTKKTFHQKNDLKRFFIKIIFF